jgi:hypothetical protein
MGEMFGCGVLALGYLEVKDTFEPTGQLLTNARRYIHVARLVQQGFWTLLDGWRLSYIAWGYGSSALLPLT